jgi:hypothetical protein
LTELADIVEPYIKTAKAWPPTFEQRRAAQIRRQKRRLTSA